VDATGDDAANAAEITAKMSPVAADVPDTEHPVELFGWTKSKDGAWVRTHAPVVEAPEPAELIGPATETPAAKDETRPANEGEPAAEAAPVRTPGPPPPPDDEEPVITSDKDIAEPVVMPEPVEATPVPVEPMPVEPPEVPVEPPAAPVTVVTPAAPVSAKPAPVIQPLSQAELMAAPTVLVPQAPVSMPVVVTPRPAPSPTVSAPRPAAPSGQGARKSSHRSRHARLRISHIGIGSLMRTALMFSVAIGIVLFVATAIVWMIVDNSGLLGQAQSIVNDVVGAGGTSGLQISTYLDTQRVLGFAALVSVINIVLFTLLAGIFAALYNAVAAMLGGIMVTLSED
jgi:hypothetical protein